jgi:dipeptidyl aminopeptidase/acylaminoacyl peptidase
MYLPDIFSGSPLAASGSGANMRLGTARLAASMVAGVIAGVSSSNAETDDGRIVFAQRDAIVETWEQLPAGYRDQFARGEFGRARAASRAQGLRVLYRSGGLRVAGFVYRPQRIRPGEELPAIVYNRGGNRDYGAIDTWDKVIFHRLADSGFVVLASQYRGAAGGEGNDEFGGSDVQDVMSLFPLARALGYVDMGNVFMLGFSRGGMMTYLAIRDGAPVRAAAVIGGLSDLPGLAAYRPPMRRMWADLWAPSGGAAESLMAERSAIRWPERLDKPLLLLHGGGDRRVPLDQSLRLAAALRAAGGTVELYVYPDDGHELARHGVERDARVVGWFRAFEARPESRRSGG